MVCQIWFAWQLSKSFDFYSDIEDQTSRLTQKISCSGKLVPRSFCDSQRLSVCLWTKWLNKWREHEGNWIPISGNVVRARNFLLYYIVFAELCLRIIDHLRQWWAVCHCVLLLQGHLYTLTPEEALHTSSTQNLTVLDIRGINWVSICLVWQRTCELDIADRTLLSPYLP